MQAFLAGSNYSASSHLLPQNDGSTGESISGGLWPDLLLEVGLSPACE